MTKYVERRYAADGTPEYAAWNDQWTTNIKRACHVTHNDLLNAGLISRGSVLVPLRPKSEGRSELSRTREGRDYWHDNYYKSAAELEAARAEVERLRASLDELHTANHRLIGLLAEATAKRPVEESEAYRDHMMFLSTLPVTEGGSK